MWLSCQNYEVAKKNDIDNVLMKYLFMGMQRFAFLQEVKLRSFLFSLYPPSLCRQNLTYMPMGLTIASEVLNVGHLDLGH